MRVGVRIGIDVGKARVGLAKSDPHGMLATPLETVQRDHEGDADVQRISEIFAEHDVLECIVGLPLNMQGNHTPSTQDAIDFARRVAQLGVQVRLVDERLSTVTAWGQLHATGKNQKSHRGIIDQAAAVVILQQALDSERLRGHAIGEAVPPEHSGEAHT